MNIQTEKKTNTGVRRGVVSIKHYMRAILIAVVALLPMTSFAQGQAASDGFTCPATPTGSITNIIDWLTCLIGGSIIPLLFALTFLYFIWGVAEFIRNADNQEKRKEGRKRMIWGIVALFVMVSVWGLVAILRNTFGVENVIPQLK